MLSRDIVAAERGTRKKKVKRKKGSRKTVGGGGGTASRSGVTRTSRFYNKLYVYLNREGKKQKEAKERKEKENNAYIHLYDAIKSALYRFIQINPKSIIP